jgi:flagellin-like hook-associated protein FlgL
MSTSTVNLSSSILQNLYSLQNIKNQMDSTENKLATGLKVNSALDDPVSYFAAQDEKQRASDLSSLKNAMSEGIQTIDAANNGITSIKDLIADAKSLAKSALSSSDDDTRASYLTQFNDLLGQIDQLASDSGYNGVNLLGGTTESLKVSFDESGTSSITVAGVDASSTGLGLTTQTTGSWATGTAGDAAINAVITALDSAKTTLQSDAKSLSTSLSTVTTRQDFTTNMINTLTTGAGNLVNADTNEESANLTTLQTQQQLSIYSLSIANTAAQAVLKLFQ